MIGGLVLMLFAAAQGGAVFVTAWVCALLLGVHSVLSKLGLMLASYVFWVALTLSGYTLLGGGGGLMEGFGLMLTLCFTALISSLVYAVVWALLSVKKGARHG